LDELPDAPGGGCRDGMPAGGSAWKGLLGYRLIFRHAQQTDNSCARSA
jgi:hypothetical protein